MAKLRFILGDHLSRSVAALRDIDPAIDVVLMAEVGSESTVVGFHKQKLVFIYSAMRHFAEELRAEGIRVDYVRLDAEGNTQHLEGELARALARHRVAGVVVTEPGAFRVRDIMNGWSERLGIPVDIREDDRFVCSHDRFASWAGDRKSLRMEFFYREMRRLTGFLMQGESPDGGQWNFDVDNRESLPPDYQPPKRLRLEPDTTTREVIDLVRSRYGKNFGDLEPFEWAVTRSGALDALDHFIAEALPGFGTYQDAMKTGEPFLHHGLVSPYLNVGLLTAAEVCAAAERAYLEGHAPLNAVEGFIRQIIGWREYIRGVYWLKMPEYAQTNELEAHRDLPWFYWSGNTRMNCMAQAIGDTSRHAYAHHIQRLMVTGNFALLAGIEPAQIEYWYLAVYIDAFDWVELPNVHGMVMFADGGLLASKPYVASGAYINRMSDYCGNCFYSPKIKEGERACPFTLLYWHFLIENRPKLGGNRRLAMPYRNLDRMDDRQRGLIGMQARAFLNGLSATTDEEPEPQLTLDL
ncbi:cryptochrome/photolyase family protein [Devosia aurantiaca]|uniref:Cryptochrome/photolyase family protein n=1 Tax=Devosia aurantiaca TaxID=2714858 RepID=A0A6M1SL12_9HYPH|nr:cryptochrome/photolyase family protein [Devosia aurantiaca]NGP17888.1 cryptochrome/photolyase family protein [Devosia aurantiaca]